MARVLTNFRVQDFKEFDGQEPAAEKPAAVAKSPEPKPKPAPMPVENVPETKK